MARRKSYQSCKGSLKHYREIQRALQTISDRENTNMGKQQANRGELDKKATIDAYRTAKKAGQWQLANKIRYANSKPESVWDLTKEFDLVDKQNALLPVTEEDFPTEDYVSTH